MGVWCRYSRRVVVGYLAMHVFPDLIEFTILPAIPAGHRDHVLMMLIGVMTIGLTRAAHEGKAFFLMGAFLTGLCFSTCHEVHHVWEHQVVPHPRLLPLTPPALLFCSGMLPGHRSSDSCLGILLSSLWSCADQTDSIRSSPNFLWRVHRF